MTLRTPHWTRSALRATIAIPSRLALLTGVRVRWQAPSSPQGELRNTSRNSAGCLHVCLRLLFASQKRKTFAVLLVPAELSHRSLIFAPRGGFAAVSFFIFFLSLEPPDAVFALHDSRVQISWRKLAIPSLRSLRGLESLSGSPPKVFSVGLFQAPENTSSRGVFSRPVWGHEPRALCALSAQPK